MIYLGGLLEIWQVVLYKIQHKEDHNLKKYTKTTDIWMELNDGEDYVEDTET